jgi:superfamily II DNA or RNA helicase
MGPGPEQEATFVPGDPAREGWLALWPVDADHADDELELALPAGTQVRRRTVPVARWELDDALPVLVDLAAVADVSPSIRAWSAAARDAVELVARGRLTPVLSPDGFDQWALGPLDPADARRRHRLAEHLPAAAHATPVGERPLRLTSPDRLLAGFGDAVADLLPRTQAALTASGHDAFAARSPITIAGERERAWLASTIPTEDAPIVILRLVPPGPGPAAIERARSVDDADGGLPGGRESDAETAQSAGPDDPRSDLERDEPGDDGTGLDGRPPGIAGAQAGAPDERLPGHPAPDDGVSDVTLSDRPGPGDDGPDPFDAPFTAEIELQSRADPSLVVPATELWDAPAAVLNLLTDADEALLLALRRGARVWPPMARLLDEARPDRLVLADPEVDDLLGPVVDDLRSAGVEVRWPTEMITPVSLRPVIATPSPAGVTTGGLTLEGVAELRWRARVDGDELSERELSALAQAKRSVVRMRGRWVRADPEQLRRTQQRRQLDAGDVLAFALGAGDLVDLGEDVAVGDDEELEIEGPLADLAARLRDLDHRDTLDAPDGLEATLRPYQKRGLAWLHELAQLGLGGVLADDMGLGKTVQLLAAHLAGADGRPTLVVCPASVIANWEIEAHRFTPAIPVRRFHGPDRSLDDLAPDELVLTTYGVVRRDGERLAEVDWRLVAADEAQAVKNPLSRTARSLRRIPATARFALTGTPVENRLSDLWALLDWTTPGLLGPLDRFRRVVAVPVERHRDPDATAALSRVVRPFLLRRRKADPTVAPELPPKTESDRVVPLTAEQASLYRATSEEILEQVAEAEGIGRRGLVLKLLTACKQICNHPAQYLGQTEPLDGRSGKLEATTELLDIVRAEGESALVFTQYVAMAHLLDQHLRAEDHRTSVLTGSVPVPRRQELVERFQAGEVDTFIISLRAGGTGLNLTQATHVVHYDRWWNPAVEDQASDRAWRIGQDRPVQVHRLIAEGTVEERIARLLNDKRSLADAVVGAGEGWVAELDDEALADLVRLGRGELDDIS